MVYLLVREEGSDLVHRNLSHCCAIDNPFSSHGRLWLPMFCTDLKASFASIVAGPTSCSQWLVSRIAISSGLYDGIRDLTAFPVLARDEI